MFRSKKIHVILLRVIPIRLIVPFAFFMFACAAKAQQQKSDVQEFARQMVINRGEVILRFVKPPFYSLDFLATFLSIDDVMHDTITVYANEAGFNRFLTFQIPYQVLIPPSLDPDLFSPRHLAGADWQNHYPAYTDYVDLMEGFAADYPDLCRVIQFGTSINGHKLLAAKITDNPAVREHEPVVLLTSTIHGDEPLGYILLLRLIEYLLVNYTTSGEVNSLVNQIEIWINPLSNPDGTYFLSDSSVAGATRFNARQEDLNRNFPDPQDLEWGSRLREPETIAMMHFMEDNKVVLAANLHGGAEVVNYPWDTWPVLHPDDSWYRKISRAYADTAHVYSPAGYLSDLDNGISNGYAWYPVYGGRQDYTNFFRHGREVTIELSHEKIPSESSLENYWNYNRQSLMGYLYQALSGIAGVVTDSLTEKPVEATISIENHDAIGSFVLSDPVNGSYYRLIDGGSYLLTIAAAGYYLKQLTVSVTDGELTLLDVQLVPHHVLVLYPNPFTHQLNIYIQHPGVELTVEFYDLSGRRVAHIRQPVVAPGKQTVATNGLAPGMYVVKIKTGNEWIKQVVMKNP